MCRMKFSLVDDFIFLNSSHNFTVNNCIAFFQVANKPVMTRTLLYSHICILRRRVWLVSHLRQTQNHSHVISERGTTLDSFNADTFILLWLI